MAITNREVWPADMGLITIGSAPALFSVNLQNTSTHDLAFVWIAPQADTISAIKVALSGVTLSPGVVRASVQSVSATTGLNSGTILGATNNAKVDVTLVAGDVGVYTFTFSESVTVAEGDVVAFVIKPLSGTWDASNYISLNYRVSNVISESVPYPINNAAKTTVGVQQIIVVGAARSYGCCLLSLGSTASLVSGGTPNEVGCRFVAPTDCSTIDCIGAILGGNSSGTRSFDLTLYDSGTTVLASKSYDTDQLITGVSRMALMLPRYTLTPGSVYHLAVKGTHASSSTTVHQFTWASAADKAAYINGPSIYHAERAGGGWTYDTAKISSVIPRLANRAVVSAGGGPLVGGRLIG